MEYNSKFGPAAQTPEQRAWVLAQMLELIPSLKTRMTAYARQVHARYVAGELSWPQMRAELDADRATAAWGA